MEKKEKSSIKEEKKIKSTEKDNNPQNHEKNEKLNKNIFKELDSLCELKHQLDLSHTTINIKAINKIIKEEPFNVPIICLQKKSENIEKTSDKPEKKEKDGFNCCQLYMFPSGITKTCSLNMNCRYFRH